MVEKLILPCSVQKHIGGRTIKMELVLIFFSWVMFTKEVKLCYKVTNVTNIFDTLMYILSLSLFLWLWLWMGSLYSRSYLVSLSSLRLFCGQREICRFEIPTFFQYFKKKKPVNYAIHNWLTYLLSHIIDNRCLCPMTGLDIRINTDN